MKLSKNTIILGVVVLLVLVLGGGACSTYNTMATQEQDVNQAWANVQSAYQRRHDHIPKLVSTVKGYAKHEKGTLTEVTAMRAGQVDKAGEELLAANNAAATPNCPNAKAVSQQAYQNLDRAYGLYINAVREAYPDLKANENFMDLQKQLEGTENRINTERNRYKKAARSLNPRQHIRQTLRILCQTDVRRRCRRTVRAHSKLRRITTAGQFPKPFHTSK